LRNDFGESIEDTVKAAAAPAQFSWNKADAGFDLATATATVSGKTLVKGAGTVAGTSAGIALTGSRFNIGTAAINTAASATFTVPTNATVLATTGIAFPTDGQFDFSSRVATVTVKYTALTYTGTGASPVFTVYLNNNTTKDDASNTPIYATGVSSKLPITSGSLVKDTSTEQTVVYTINPATYTTGFNTLGKAFLQIRTDSTTSIMISSIVVAYQ